MWKQSQPQMTICELWITNYSSASCNLLCSQDCLHVLMHNHHMLISNVHIRSNCSGRCFRVLHWPRILSLHFAAIDCQWRVQMSLPINASINPCANTCPYFPLISLIVLFQVSSTPGDQCYRLWHWKIVCSANALSKANDDGSIIMRANTFQLMYSLSSLSTLV